MNCNELSIILNIANVLLTVLDIIFLCHISSLNKHISDVIKPLIIQINDLSNNLNDKKYILTKVRHTLNSVEWLLVDIIEKIKPSILKGTEGQEDKHD